MGCSHGQNSTKSSRQRVTRTLWRRMVLKTIRLSSRMQAYALSQRQLIVRGHHSSSSGALKVKTRNINDVAVCLAEIVKRLRALTLKLIPLDVSSDTRCARMYQITNDAPMIRTNRLTQLRLRNRIHASPPLRLFGPMLKLLETLRKRQALLLYLSTVLF